MYQSESASGAADTTMNVTLAELQEVPAANHPPRPVIDVHIGPHSESNFYVGFEPRLGVFVATYRRLPLGVSVAVRIHLPGQVRWAAEGYVHWTRDTVSCDVTPGLGVRLDHISPRALERAQRFMAQREPLFFPER